MIAGARGNGTEKPWGGLLSSVFRGGTGWGRLPRADGLLGGPTGAQRRPFGRRGAGRAGVHDQRLVRVAGQRQRLVAEVQVAYAVYGTAKAALTHLSATLRAELGPRDVRVANIGPGLTDTELGQYIDNQELAEQLGGMYDAIGTLASDDVADLIGFVASRPAHVNLRQVICLPTRQA